MFAWGNASAATCTFNFQGLPSPGAYKGEYSVLVTFVYTWTHELDRPKNGGSVKFLEYDPSGSYPYGTDPLAAPANAGNASGTWSNKAFFSKVVLSAASANDEDSTLETRATFTVHAPLVDKEFNSPYVNVDLIPSTPTKVIVPALSADGKMTIYWYKSEGSIYYRIQRKVDSLGIWGTRYDSMGGNLSYDDSGTAGHIYYYRVCGINTKGQSAWRTGTNGCVVPVGKPASLAIPTTDADGSYTINWGAAAGANRYELQERESAGMFWLNVYSGSSMSKERTGKTPGRTYLYRVRGANSGSGLNGAWVTGANGVLILKPGAVAFQKTSISVTEGMAFATLKVVRTNGTSGAASVNYQTMDVSALAGQDYTKKSGTLNWADGESTTKTIKVPLLDDTATEAGEAFKVKLSGATGATLGYPRVTKVKIASNTKDAYAQAIPGTGGLSWQEIILDGPGTLEFDWRILSEDPADTLILMDNGVVVSTLSGSADWARKSVILTEGAHTIRWVYTGDLDDAGFIDCVRLAPNP
jgi:hypothetical protein